jgi:hypothetical protein
MMLASIRRATGLLFLSHTRLVHRVRLMWTTNLAIGLAIDLPTDVPPKRPLSSKLEDMMVLDTQMIVSRGL